MKINEFKKGLKKMQYYYSETEDNTQYVLIEINKNNINNVVFIDKDPKQDIDSVRNELAMLANSEYDLGITAADIDHVDNL